MSDGVTEDTAGPKGSNGGAPAAEDVGALRAALAAAEESARSSRDQYLRAAAELDNVRKRAQRDIENAHRYALERFAGELLPVRDSLELAAASSGGDVKSLIEGQSATLKLLARAFDKYGIKQLDPSGQIFDPAQHEAVVMQESATAPPSAILHVVQSGYQLGDRLLRPARVVVAKPPDA